MNKLLGANFLTDRRDDINNFKLEPISDKIGEISFIKKCTNISGNVQYKDFAWVETIKEEIEQTFNNRLLALDPNDPTFEARKYSINMKRAKSLDSLESMVFHKKKYNQKRTFSILKIRSKTA